MAELKILTFNVWGLAFVTKDRPARLAAIAAYLAQAPYDVVCLQEIWIHKEFEAMRDDIRGNYTYSRFFHTGALGSGLAIFSRFPITSAKALPYALSGLPSEVIAGDFFVNKAAGRVVIEHPSVGEIEVWNTHMHAAGESPPDTRQAHRMAQAWELATEVRRGAAAGHYIFCMGDFNSQPFSVPIALLRTYGELKDSYLEVHPRANDAPAVGIAAVDAIKTLGMTCDSSLNSYSAGKNIPPSITAQGGKRLDYIFFREGRGARFSVHCTQSEVVLDELVPGHNFSYSDHFGLTSTFKFEPRSEKESAPVKVDGDVAAAVNPFLPPASSTTTASGRDSPTSAYELSRAHSAGATVSAIRAALTTLRDYTLLASRRTQTFNLVTALSIVVAIGLTIGSAWQPKSWIQPIFTIVAFAAGAIGATYLYWGWLYGRWERGVLDETMADMELEISILCGERE